VRERDVRAPVVAARGPLPLWLLPVVLLAAWGAHASALDHGWVFDDFAVVARNPVVEGRLGGLGRAFEPGAWGGEVEPDAWRPLTLLSFRLEAPLWRGADRRLDPRGFHLTNLLLHGLVALLLLLVAARFAPRRWAFLAGLTLAFAVHPLHAGTVSAAVGRADLLALLLSLVALRLWFAGRREEAGGTAFVPLAGLAFFLALLAKEAALGLPLAVLLLHGAESGGVLAALRRRPLGHAALLVPALLWAFLSPGVPGPGGSGVAAVPNDLGARLAWGLEGATRTLLGFLLPVGLVRDRLAASAGWAGLAPSALAAALGGLLLLALVAAGSRARGAPGVRGSLGLLFALAIPAALVGTPGAAAEARFAYVAAVGLFVLAGAAFEALLRPRGAGRLAGVAAAAGIVVALGALTRMEAAAWKDDGTWHRALLERQPGSTHLTIRLGRHLRAEAEEARLRATLLPAGSPEHRREVALARRGLQEAHDVLAPASRLPVGRLDAALWREYGAVLEARGETPAAYPVLSYAATLDPWLARPIADVPPRHRLVLADLLTRLGRSQEAQGDMEDATESLYRAALYAPEDADVLRRAGVALVRVQRYAEAIPLFERALERTRDPILVAGIEKALAEARTGAAGAAEAAVREGMEAEERADVGTAQRAYERALAIEPRQMEAYERLAEIHAFKGNYREAWRVLDRAEAVLREVGRGPGDPPWQRLADIRARIEAGQAAEGDEEGRDPGGG
jgi:tetratricopeptide (TPR) repeat protein